MKPILIITLVLLLPALLICNIFNPIDSKESLGQSFPKINPNNANRIWRIQEARDSVDYDTVGSFTPNSKYEYFYNAVNPEQIDSIRIFSGDFILQQFDHIFTYVYHYNPLTGNLDYSIMNTNGLYPDVLKKKYVYDYDNQNRLTKVKRFSLISGEWVWINSIDYFYADNRLVLEIITRELNNPLNRNYSKIEFQHDSNGRMIYHSQSTSSDSVSWVLCGSTEIVYAADDNTTGQDFIDYLSHQEMYDLLYSIDYVGKISNVVFTTIDSVGFVTKIKYVYQYNPNNTLYEIISQSSLDDVWQTNSKIDYFYDANGNFSQLNSYGWMEEQATWTSPIAKLYFIWEQPTANEDEYLPVSDLQISAFPNPFRNDVQINFRSDSKSVVKADVYNIKGQLVKSLGISKNQSFKWDGKDKCGAWVGNGIYFIKTSQNGKTITNKLIKMQ